MTQLVYDNKKGYITLVAVMFIGMVILTLVVSLSTWGVKALKTSTDLGDGEKAKSLADSCMEEGLQQLYMDYSYAGIQTVTMDIGSCDFTVSNLGGDSREVQATGTVGEIVRRVKVQTDAYDPKINITSWQEVADF